MVAALYHDGIVMNNSSERLKEAVDERDLITPLDYVDR